MPYIKGENKRNMLRPGAQTTAESPGELNFQITEIINAYLAHHGLSYATINDILGATEGAKQEFYRRVAVPYENEKLAENGDVYDRR